MLPKLLDDHSEGRFLFRRLRTELTVENSITFHLNSGEGIVIGETVTRHGGAGHVALHAWIE